MNARLNSLTWSTLAILMLSTAAHAAAPLQDIVDAPITIKADGSRFSVQEVQAAIVEACSAKRWVPSISGPGKITASINVRGKHFAEIAIPFDETKYSITYVSSQNLDYLEHRTKSGELKREIHRNYNKWVQLLSQAISARLATRTGS